RCREGRRRRWGRSLGGRPPRRLPTPSPLPERERVAALKRRVDDLGHPVVVAITITHATKVRSAPDGTVVASEPGYWSRAPRDPCSCRPGSDRGPSGVGGSVPGRPRREVALSGADRPEIDRRPRHHRLEPGLPLGHPAFESDPAVRPDADARTRNLVVAQ